MSRQEILERERRWRLPAAIAALVALVLLIIPAVIQGGALEGDTDAERLTSLNAESGSFLLGAIVGAIGYAALLVPLLYVFLAARARSDAVRGVMLGFVVVGPLLFGAQSALQGVAVKEIAADFTAAGGAADAEPYEQAAIRELAAKESVGGAKKTGDGAKQSGDAVEEVTLYPDANAYEVEKADGSFQRVEFPAAQETQIRERLEGGEFEFTIDEDGNPGDAQILRLQEDSSLSSVASQLLFPALLALIVGLFYTALQAMRTGLFTRFFGTLGMALAVSVLLLGPTGLIVFVAGLGLVIMGRTPGGRPPAWEAGEAIPWPSPGEQEARDAADVLEGDADEVDSDGESPHAARRQRAKRKRKKRR